ncbi:MAG: carbon storage regulator CsrA [Phycisphaerales bacterium]
MLVLSRQRDETIMIGDDIEITVVDIRGDKVRLGITAPTRIAVHRKEVYDAITRENEQASKIANGAIEEITQKIRPGPARNATRAKADRLTAGRPDAEAPTPRVANGAKAQTPANGHAEGMRGAG